MIITSKGGAEFLVDDDFSGPKTGWLEHRGYGKKKGMFLHHWVWGEVVELDHINGNPRDNRRANLRQCTRTQNMQNRKGWGSVGFKGVMRSSNGKGFRARIVVNGKPINLGTFMSAETAHEAYCAAAKKHHGEFANTAHF